MPLVIYDGQTTSFVAKIRSWNQLNRNQLMKSETLTILEDIAYSWMGADKEIYLVHSSTLYAMKIDKIPATL